MKVILNAEKVENEFYPKQNSKKRGNLLKINENREYIVKEIATDSYGTFLNWQESKNLLIRNGSMYQKLVQMKVCMPKQMYMLLQSMA